jgi:hypothetical protein
MAASALIVINVMWRDPGSSSRGLAIIAAGVPMYLLMKRAR